MASNLNVFKDASEFVYYNNPAIPLYVVHGDLISFENLRALCHWHEDVEFLLPLKGHLAYRVNETDYRIETGQCIFVNSRQLHYGYSIDGSDCFYICILFKPSLLTGNEELYQRYFAPILEQPGLEAFVFTPEDPSHLPILQALRHVYELYHPENPETKEDAPELLALGSLFIMWKHLFKVLSGQFFVTTSSASQDACIQKQILQFLYSHADEKLTLHDLAHAGGISRTKCCQLFQRFFNRSPIDYLNDYRIEKSVELLRTTDLSVTEISIVCGFGNPSYFAEIFRKHKGCSPSGYRKHEM